MNESVDVPRKETWAMLEQYRIELITQARSILDNLDDVEDCVQETFVEALAHEDRLHNARSLAAWLKAINRCKALARVRGRRSDKKRLQGKRHLAADDLLTTGGIRLFDLREAVGKSLEELPAELREIIRLRYFEHLSYKDIADKLRIPIGNIGGMLMDGSVRLYARLKKRLDNSSKTIPPKQPMRVSTNAKDDQLPSELLRGVL